MRKSRFTEAQIIGILAEAERTGHIGAVVRRHGIALETFYRRRRKYGGLGVPDAKRLKALEDENRRLKRVLADQALAIQVLKDVLGKEWWRWSSGGPSSGMSFSPPEKASGARVAGSGFTGVLCAMCRVETTSRYGVGCVSSPRSTPAGGARC